MSVPSAEDLDPFDLAQAGRHHEVLADMMPTPSTPSTPPAPRIGAPR